MNVQVGRIFIQRMKTRWGSCNPAARAIRLNTELAKKNRPSASNTSWCMKWRT
jgi:predicted metal-dependent hydrolase